MADVQKQFFEFHGKIKLLRFEENQTLRDERDEVISALKAGLKAIFPNDADRPSVVRYFDQGSYDMNTGIKPLPEGEYDIDTGVVISRSMDDHGPVLMKQWVRNALENQGRTADIRRSCVTVFKDGYHVDLAVYADPDLSRNRALNLAKGKENSGDDHRFWEKSDPEGLADLIADRFSGDDAAQFRRCIRDLKRWRDERYGSATGNAIPIGIGITVAAYHWFSVNKRTDGVSRKVTYDDRAALEGFVRTLINNFSFSTYDNTEQKSMYRLSVSLPIEPYSDLFAKMTDKQMSTFKEKLEVLLTALAEAREKVEVSDACAVLARQFGRDFPTPTKEETSTRTRLPVSGSGSSGF
jgi:hypothetical protein